MGHYSILWVYLAWLHLALLDAIWECLLWFVYLVWFYAMSFDLWFSALRFCGNCVVHFHVCFLTLCFQVCSNRVGHSYCPFACVSEWFIFSDAMCRWRVEVLKDYCVCCDCMCLIFRFWFAYVFSKQFSSLQKQHLQRCVCVFHFCKLWTKWHLRRDYEKMMLRQSYLAVSPSTGTCSRLQQCITRGTAAFVAFNLW